MNHRSRTFVMHLNCCAFTNWTPIQVLRTILAQKGRNESQMTTLHATLDPFVVTLTTTNMASRTSPQWLRIFSTMLAQKIQNMAFKTSKLDQIALEYWYYGFLGRLRVDGRGFLHQKPIVKKRSPEQKSRCRTSEKRVTVPLTRSVKYTFLLISNSLLSFGSYRSKIESI